MRTMVAATAICMIITAAFRAAEVRASSEEPSDGTDALQEVIVTAQKREQRLSDVGMSIVAQTGRQLQDIGVVDASQLAKISPGFTASQSQNGFPIFSIRGVNFNSNQISAAPTVSTYIDEAALPFPAMTGALLLDVARIEVLKGPQGTLFGQNATGGSINVIAAKPTATLAAGMHGEVNQFGQLFVEGYLSGPLTDTLRARFSAQTTQFGRWQYSRYNDQRNGNQNKSAARLLLDWQPSDALRFELNLNGNYDHGEPQSPQFVQWTFAVPPQLGGNVNPNYAEQVPSNRIRVADLPAGFNPRNDTRQYQAVLRGELDLSNDLKLISISDYVNNRFGQLNNFGATFLPTFFVNNMAEAESFSQELRLTGSIPGQRLNYIVGGNYQRDSPLDSRFDFNLLQYSPLPSGTRVGTDLTESNQTGAGFANADWEFLDGLTLTGGGRYTEVKHHFTGCGSVGNDSWTAGQEFLSGLLRSVNGGRAPLPAGTFQPGSCSALSDFGDPDAASFGPYEYDQHRTETNWSWRAGLNYKPTAEVLVYGLVSRGYKSGVYPANVAPVASQLPYISQEQLTSYEVGTKISVWERKLEFDLSGFYYDYRNKQLYTYKNVFPFGPVATAVNIPKSSVPGVDFSLRVNPLRGWSISGGMTYIRSKIKEVDPTTQTYDLTLHPVPIVGNRFNFAPDWSGTVDTEYRFATAHDLQAVIGGGLQFASQSYSDLAQSSLSTLPSYVTLDARIGLESAQGWRVSVWSRNLTDKLYLTNVISSGDTIARYTGLPRTFGLSFGFDL